MYIVIARHSTSLGIQTTNVLLTGDIHEAVSVARRILLYRYEFFEAGTKVEVHEYEIGNVYSADTLNRILLLPSTLVFRTMHTRGHEILEDYLVELHNRECWEEAWFNPVLEKLVDGHSSK